jgi:hypothetical protein
VLIRDGFRCVAPQIDGRAGWCRDAFGSPIPRWSGWDPGPRYLQMSHTKDSDELSMGSKAPDDIWHLVALCPFHHTGTAAGSNWEAVHRNEIRRYIIEANEPGRRLRQGAQSSRR